MKGIALRVIFFGLALLGLVDLIAFNHPNISKLEITLSSVFIIGSTAFILVIMFLNKNDCRKP